MVKCTDCKKEFRNNERGCKLVPKPLCHDCVIRNKVHTCNRCGSFGSVREGFFNTSCWVCNTEGCTRCIPNTKWAKGIEFDFCHRHKDYSMKELIKDAEDLLEDENSQKDGKVSE